MPKTSKEFAQVLKTVTLDAYCARADNRFMEAADELEATESIIRELQAHAVETRRRIVNTVPARQTLALPTNSREHYVAEMLTENDAQTRVTLEAAEAAAESEARTRAAEDKAMGED